MILLKKSLDEILKKYNLPSLNIERIKLSGGKLQLCTPCGKPIMFIKDVQIPHTKLKIEEREYILKELSAFIIDNVDTIKEVIKITSNPLELKEYDNFVVHASTTTNWKTQKTYITELKVYIKEKKECRENFSLMYDGDGKYQINASYLPPEKLKKYMEYLPEMKKIAKENYAIKEVMIEQENFIKELTTCKN